MARLDGQVAIITGAGRGLGRGYALRLAGLGAKICVVDADLASHEAFEGEGDTPTAAEIRALGGEAIEATADVADAAAIAAAVHQTVAAWGRIDVAICNAGGGRGSPPESRPSIMNLDEFDAVLKANLYGTVNTVAAVAPTMKAQGYGKIITVSSQAGRVPGANGDYAHYGTAKAGIIMYTRYLAQELGPHGITANCIAPGYIVTARLKKLFDQIGTDRVTSMVPLGRLGTVEDCAKVIEFLSTDLSDYVTGALIAVDGGTVR